MATTGELALAVKTLEDVTRRELFYLHFPISLVIFAAATMAGWFALKLTTQTGETEEEGRLAMPLLKSSQPLSCLRLSAGQALLPVDYLRPLVFAPVGVSSSTPFLPLLSTQ